MLISTTSAGTGIIGYRKMHGCNRVLKLIVDSVKKTNEYECRESTFGLTWTERSEVCVTFPKPLSSWFAPYSQGNDLNVATMTTKVKEDGEDDNDSNSNKNDSKKKSKPYQRDIIIDPSAPKSSLVYRIS